MVDLGSGPPLLLIPGLQGRWEWMRPSVLALAGRCRVVTASLAGDPGSDAAVNPARGFDSLVDQIDGWRARARLERVAVCGVSFGGWVALRYAATRPDRVSALVLVSTPGPDFRTDGRVRRYVRRPVLMAPLFAAGAPLRLGPEIVAAHDSWPARLAFAVRHSSRVLGAPMSPTRMSQRMRLVEMIDVRATCAAVRAPTLVITGEPGLDRVVSVEGTRRYVDAIGGARHVTLERTGHIGLVSRPRRFADVVGGFLDEVTNDAAPRP